MSYAVTVLLPNGRRHKMPVKLNTPILMILEETCKKHKLNPTEFDLTFHNRTLDLTSNIQFSGITNNALLELSPAAKARTETPVSIFLQLENGERLSGSFPPSHTLWEIISELCDAETKSKENPVIIFTRQEVYGDKLKLTTLKMLGLTSGKALLRLLHRTVEQLKNQSVSSVYKLPLKPKPVVEEKLGSAVRKTVLPEKPASEENLPSVSPVSSETLTSTKDAHVSSPMETEPMNREKASPVKDLSTRETVLETPASSSQLPRKMFNQLSSADKIDSDTPKNEMPKFDINDVQFIGDKYALIFHVESIPSPKFSSPEGDDFYELTVEDAKTLLRDIKRTRSELEEADFETSAARAKKKSMLLERRLSIYPYCIVRIIFPNRIILQGIFQSTDSVLDVISFTKTFVDEFILNFYLYVAPPKRILKAEETLIEIGAVPGINLYFGLDEIDSSQGNRILKQKFLNKAVPAEVAFEVANYFRRTGGVKAEPVEIPESSPSNDVKPRPPPKLPDDAVAPRKPAGGKVPKWFKPL